MQELSLFQREALLVLMRLLTISQGRVAYAHETCFCYNVTRYLCSRYWFQRIGNFVNVLFYFTGIQSSCSKDMFLIHRDAVLVCLLDLIIGFSGGFVIFIFLGHVAYKSGLKISDFQQSGIESLWRYIFVI